MDTPPGTELLDQLLRRCRFPDVGVSVTAACSGGPDSTALLALAVHAGLDVTAVHVHHGLRDSADHDADIARLAAERLGAPFRVERAPVADGANLEARARAARHEALGPDAMTGHTMDDQAETVLLALLRGSGATGLSAMRPGPRHPILALRRVETHELCRRLDVPVADDPTNESARFRRNRVRREVLPLLDQVADRDVVPLLDRAAGLLRSDDDLLGRLAARLDPTDASALRAAPEPLARRALRSWLTSDGYPPDAAAIDRLLEVVHLEAEACEISGGRRVTRTAGRLRVEPS